MKLREIFKWTLFFGIGVLIFVLLLELSLRVLGIYKSQAEQTGGSFFSAYETFDRTHHWAWPANYEAKIDYTEFSYSFLTNSLGLRDREHALEKSDSTFRILMMGDSYIESFGSPNGDSTILNFMEKQLNTGATERKFEVMSGASAGSDLFFCYLFFKSNLMVYNPDLVVLNINSTDIMDYCSRGGLDRMAQDGRIQFLPTPINTTLYQHCHVYRFWVHEIERRDRNTFLKPQEIATCQYNFVKDARAVLAGFEELAIERGFRFRVVVYPILDELPKKRYPQELEAIRRIYGIDVMDSLARHQAQCTEMLYWPIDGHFTPHGYEVFSRVLVNSLIHTGALGPD